MEVNWDDIIEDAEMAIPVMLAELLAKADDITNLVVLYHLKGDKAPHAWRHTQSQAVSLGMLEYEKHLIMHELMAAVDEE